MTTKNNSCLRTVMGVCILILGAYLLFNLETLRNDDSEPGLIKMMVMFDYWLKSLITLGGVFVFCWVIRFLQEAADHKRISALGKHDRLAMANDELARYDFGPGVKMVGSSGGWHSEELSTAVFIQNTNEAQGEGRIEMVVFKVRVGDNNNVSEVSCYHRDTGKVIGQRGHSAATVRQ